MGFIELEGGRAVIDISKTGLEFGSPEFVNQFLKAYSGLETTARTIRFEEEIIIELDEEKTEIFNEYSEIIRQVEGIMIRPEVYGHKQDEMYYKRKELLRKFYDFMFMSPLRAKLTLEEYDESLPSKQIFMKGYQTFKAWVNGIKKTFINSKFFDLCKKTGDVQAAFFNLTGLGGIALMSTVSLPIPKGAVAIKSSDANYKLKHNITVSIYEVPGKETYYYLQSNPILSNLKPELKQMLIDRISDGLNGVSISGDVRIIFTELNREFRSIFLDQAMLKEIDIKPEEATVMAYEATSWVIGLGAPTEDIAIDKNVTDIYIDSQNAPLYIDHNKFGVCHTLWRYNQEMLEKQFSNIMFLSGQDRKFDKSNPVVDVVVPRLNMRCHMQRPPATFGDLQAALRIMRKEPFTYPLYLYHHSFTPFFAGYDDLMVSLGNSEAVLGLKSVGKTAFTSAKILAIGTKKRILPIQDIEEIPVRAYRKRGFHIGAMRVQSSDKEEVTGDEMDLVSMANASLRMGDACLIINEIRSRLAIQGVMNLLNTQPGVFLLYNLHAQSLQDVQDRLELVFGMPGASMYSTDRYTFLKKLRFGRKSRLYRIVGNQHESDIHKKKFVEVFTFTRADNIDDCVLQCNFLNNPEASMWDLSEIDLGKLQSEIDFKFIPPALKRRSDETGILPEQLIMEAFFKGKMYHDIRKSAFDTKDPYLMEIDFVLKCNTAANNLLKSIEDDAGNINYKDLQSKWDVMFKEMVALDVLERNG